MSILNLDQMEGATAIRRAVSEATGGNKSIFVLIEGEVYTVTPPGATKEILAKDIARRVAENPAILSEIQKRIETEEPEDWA